MFDGTRDHWEPPPQSNWWWVVVVIVVGLIFLGMIGFAFPHDYKHPEHKAWYKSLNSSGGAPCCDGEDAHHIADMDWDTSCDQNNFGEKRCHYRVFLHNKWRDVPANAVIDGPNRDGSALVWEIPQLSEDNVVDTTIRCFLPGAGG